MAQMRFHKKILTSAQFDLIKQLGPFMTEHSCYLGGGTAIALMLGHRKSVDLDWFSEKPIDSPEEWVINIQAAGVSLKDVDLAKGTLHATSNGVRISLLEYRYPMLRRLVKWKSVDCHLASLDDLACMKLSAIVSRDPRKDFIDIYALMRKHKSLQQMLQLFQKRFPEAEVFSVVRGLSYFDNADKFVMPEMLWKIEWPEIKEYILAEVKKALP